MRRRAASGRQEQNRPSLRDRIARFTGKTPGAAGLEWILGPATHWRFYTLTSLARETLEKERGAERSETKQGEKRKQAGCLGQLLRFDHCWGWCGGNDRRGSCSYRSGFRDRRSHLNYFGNRNFFLLRSYGDDFDHFQISGVGGHCWNGFFDDDGQLNGSGLRVNKFLAEVIAGIEPGLEGFRIVARALGEFNDGVAGRSEAVVVDGQDGGDEMRAIGIEDLHDVAVGR